jgi:hypothetical protein
MPVLPPDGVGVWVDQVPFLDSGNFADRRVLLELPAVGGSSQLRCAGESVARVEHSWVPQQFDLTEYAGQEVRLETKAEAKSKFGGFLPVIGHSPVGAWIAPRWRCCGAVAFDRLPILARRDGVLHLQLSVESWPGEYLPSHDLRAERSAAVQLRVNSEFAQACGRGQWKISCAPPPAWSPDQPNCERLRLELLVDGAVSDALEVPWAKAELRAEGQGLKLNDENFAVRGLLHWGYYPDLAGPDPGTDDLRAELLQMKARGFNLLKACLWVPSNRFLSLCDEVGMAVWIEYPLWDHPLSGGSELSPELATYRSWVQHDVLHPCVILRSLTCENDRVDADAAWAICAMIREMAPDGLVNDNSAWLDCNHHPEFWDEHPYLHAAQWPWYLQRLQLALAQRPDRPLILGETMAFDALTDAGSRQAAVDLRQFQATTLVQAFPQVGYVICAARDIPQSPLGLQDEHGVWKTEPDAWAWQKSLPGGNQPRKPSSTSFPEIEPAAAPGITHEISHEVEPTVADETAAVRLTDRLPSAVLLREKLDAQTIVELQAGASVIHLAGARSHSWRTPEHTFWSPVASWDACFESIEIDLFHEFMSGRALQPPPAGQARILAAAQDVHDLQGEKTVQPFLLIAQVGTGRLLVSSLRHDLPAGQQLLVDLAARLANQNDSLCRDLPQLTLDPPPRSFFLDGPWKLKGDGVREGQQIIQVGTMLQNRGANAVQGWVSAEADFTLPLDWQGPVIFRAEGVGDGFELYLDDESVLQHGRLGYTWDAGRDVPATVDLSKWVLPGQSIRWRIRTKDHRGAGVLIGPLYLCAGEPDACVLY